jgi:outer membrane lipoprotein SlyB
MNSQSPTYENEIVAIFRSPEQLDAAVSDLCSAGWDRAELSLLGKKNELAPNTSAEDIAHNAIAPHSPVVSDSDERQDRTLAGSLAGVVAGFIASGAIVASGGTAVVALIGAAAAGGGGAVAGNFIGSMLTKQMAEPIEEQIDRGGIVLWALLRSSDQEGRARDIFSRHGADDIHVQQHAA